MSIVMCVWIGLATMLSAEQPDVHYWHQGVMPPGAIGSLRLQRGGPVFGFYQPVEIKAPAGALVSLAVANQFDEPKADRRTAGLLIGSVYRLRVTNIHGAEGAEVFPSVEVIDRIYAPAGQERRFAIPVEIAEDDLKLAIAGKFVTRVIYLEDPQRAMPVRSGGQPQQWFDVGPGRDPLAGADILGRPVAILRMGGRLPDPQPTPEFFFGSPTFVDLPAELNAAPTAAASAATPIAAPKPERKADAAQTAAVVKRPQPTTLQAQSASHVIILPPPSAENNATEGPRQP
jgi:hypothetical protein